MTRTLKIAAAAVLLAGVAATTASAWDQYPFDEYFQRTDRVTLGAGDAKEANTATHVIDPWPPYAGNRHIPGNGERMSAAVERSRDVSKLNRAPRPLRPIFDVESGISGGGGGGAGGGGGGR